MKTLSLVDLFSKFPDEPSAAKWFEQKHWPDGERCCLHCGSMDAVQNVASGKPMPYRCGDCRRYFSMRTGTCMEGSNLSLRKWAIAIYLVTTRPKGVSSVQLGKDLGITQKTAWFLGHRIREGFSSEMEAFDGPVEMDEAYMGGKEKNRHWDKKLKLGRGTAGKHPVIGVRDRPTGHVAAEPVAVANRTAAEEMFYEKVRKGADLFTDESRIYDRIDNRETVKHKNGEYVRGAVHTNGIESFWALLKRGYHGTCHWMSPKHLHRYCAEFTGRLNSRGDPTLDRMGAVFAGMVGKRLLYREFTA